MVRFEARCDALLLNRSMANINNQVFALPLVIKGSMPPRNELSTYTQCIFPRK